MTDNHRKALRSWGTFCYCIAVFFVLVLIWTLVDSANFVESAAPWYAGGGVVIFIVSGTVARIIAAYYK